MQTEGKLRAVFIQMEAENSFVPAVVGIARIFVRKVFHKQWESYIFNEKDFWENDPVKSLVEEIKKRCGIDILNKTIVNFSFEKAETFCTLFRIKPVKYLREVITMMQMTDLSTEELIDRMDYIKYKEGHLDDE